MTLEPGQIVIVNDRFETITRSTKDNIKDIERFGWDLPTIEEMYRKICYLRDKIKRMESEEKQK
jgi:hypothetical protein